jgi:hypothetical protein
MSQRERRPGKSAHSHNKRAMSSETIAEDQEKKFRRNMLATMVRDARRLGCGPKPGQIKSLKGFLEGIDLGGGSCASHSDIAARVLTSDPRSKTGHVTRDKIGRDLAYWVRIGLLTRRWKTIMLPNMQPTRKYVYQVANRVMTALKSLGRLVRRPKDNAHSLQRRYRDSGMGRVAAIQRPQPSLADLIRKYFGDEAADVYLAAQTKGEECRKAAHTGHTGHGANRAMRRFAKSRLRLDLAWRRLFVILKSCVNRGSSARFPAGISSTPQLSPEHTLPHSSMAPEW